MVKKPKVKNGKFIVLDGTDGSGKATQIGLLTERLKLKGFRPQVLDFPRYGMKSAYQVEQYLNGVYGSAKNLGPYIPSIFYATDRFAASFEARELLEKGATLISNRYVTASMGHQGGKITSHKERFKFYKWLNNLEYGIFQLPKPDLTLILHVPAGLAQKLVDKKAARKYIHGKKRDLHEKDLGHLKAAERTFLEISRKFGYPIIECCDKNKILSPEIIADLIWKKVSKILPS